MLREQIDTGRQIFPPERSSPFFIFVGVLIHLGAELTSCSPHSVAEVIATFLNSLPVPIIPLDLLPTTDVDQQGMRPWCRSFLAAIPGAVSSESSPSFLVTHLTIFLRPSAGLQYNVFLYTVTLFREILKYSEFSKITPESLGFLLTMILTGYIDTSRQPTFREVNSGPFPIPSDLKKDSRHNLMVPIMTYFLTAPAF